MLIYDHKWHCYQYFSIVQNRLQLLILLFIEAFHVLIIGWAAVLCTSGRGGSVTLAVGEESYNSLASIVYF